MYRFILNCIPMVHQWRALLTAKWLLRYLISFLKKKNWFWYAKIEFDVLRYFCGRIYSNIKLKLHYQKKSHFVTDKMMDCDGFKSRRWSFVTIFQQSEKLTLQQFWNRLLNLARKWRNLRLENAYYMLWPINKILTSSFRFTFRSVRPSYTFEFWYPFGGKWHFFLNFIWAKKLS